MMLKRVEQSQCMRQIVREKAFEYEDDIDHLSRLEWHSMSVIPR